MNKYSFVPVLFLFFIFLIVISIVWVKRSNDAIDRESFDTRDVVKKEIGSEEVVNSDVPSSYEISQKVFVGQTFNNCGPASLSMIYSLLGVSISQSALAEKIRPYNNPQGGLDDKSVFADEFVSDAKSRGFEAVSRPNGSNEILEGLISSDLPVVVRTWLNAKEDIGHFRVVRGYDRNLREFIVDDSYNGSNLRIGYDELNLLWQPFNYSYIVIYKSEKSKLVERVLGSNFDEKNAWRNALRRAERESENDPESTYASFNKSTAYSILGEHEKAIEEFEGVENILPKRMLWYQFEILESYLKVKNYNRVFDLSERIMGNDNLAFSEMYILRGDAFKAKGEISASRAEYEKAEIYNKNYKGKLY